MVPVFRQDDAVGDFFDKPNASGGLDISRPLASLILAIAIVLLILLVPERPGRSRGGRRGRSDSPAVRD